MRLGRAAYAVLGSACSYKEELRVFYEAAGVFLLTEPSAAKAPAVPVAVQQQVSSVAKATTAEFGLGLHLSQIQSRDRFIEKAKALITSNALNSSVSAPLKAWIDAQGASSTTAGASVAHGKEVYRLFGDSTLKTTHADFYKEAGEFLLTPAPSRWLLGGDRLAVDIGASGVHHVIASKANVNILLLDTQPYTEKKDPNGGDVRKKDVGLYAMTYGGVYVASVALQSSYAGVVRALTEADAFNGPSVVLAYAPRVAPAQAATNGVLARGPAGGLAATAALAALKETKMAVDEGYWPLYRWQPAAEGDASFHLDSDKMRGELEAFLERDRHVSLLARSDPVLAVAPSVEQELRENVEFKIRASYAALVANLNTTPVLVLYGSDGGAASSAAKRLAAEAKQRGLKPRVSVMDEFAVEDFAGHEHVVFVVSTAGQGEFPGNSRETWKALQGLKKGEGVDLSKMRFAVFGMGDSHYWPPESDPHGIFYCKSGKDLDAKLEALGAPRLVSLGLGNDRDADGWKTGYNTFTAELWAALGVDAVEVSGAAVMVPSDDAIKESSNFLRGTIAPGLEDTSTGALTELDGKLTKFHGIYQQDDRDIRESRLRAGLEAAYSFMVRVRVPGGVATPEQWIAVDDIADKLANGTIKLTTRQAFQFHGIVKSKLKKSIQEINHALMDTIAACGDVNRNVMCNPNPTSSRVHAQVQEFSRKFSTHLTPNTNAYHEIWLDKKMVVTSEDVEPIYGKTYLPRKFKVAVAVPPHNDVDVFAHDLGYIAITEGDNLIGFNVTVGGGMGMTHGMKTTYPRLADVLGFCTVEEAVNVGEKVVLVQRDFGDRTNRKHARLKYTIDDRGIDWFRGEVEQRLGYKMQPARPYKFVSNGDRYGWSEGVTGLWSYTLFIANGRVKDDATRLAKTGLRAIADDYVRRGVKGVEFRLTPNQHLMIAGVPAGEKWKLEAFLNKYGLENGNLGGLRQNSMACVALPTCALAMAESERYLPDLVGKIEDILAANGLREEAITIRMTGCPNGCARPQIAEIAFVGKAPGTYNMYLGGGFTGERLNKIYKENVTEPEILKELTPIIQDYSRNKIDGEHFGDFVIRKNYVKATTAGKNFHDV
ncbi:putative sulfite reductase cys-4 [Chytriomyces sp. MP71]|nr:putative sulfite reductase cys-4 [Chytriomyces sp. MP71]